MPDNALSSRARRIDTQEAFMNHNNGNDLLYSYLLGASSYNPETNQVYLTSAKLKEISNALMFVMNCGSKRSVNYQINKLVEAGLIKYDMVLVNGANKRCMIFVQPERRFNLVLCDMLIYIANTRNKLALRIYNYLLTGWKVAERSNRIFTFSIASIKRALGYSGASSSCDKIILDNLRSFACEGIIHYEERYILDDSNVPVPTKFLNYIALSPKEVAANANLPPDQEMKYALAAEERQTSNELLSYSNCGFYGNEEFTWEP